VLNILDCSLQYTPGMPYFFVFGVV